MLARPPLRAYQVGLAQPPLLAPVEDPGPEASIVVERPLRIHARVVLTGVRRRLARRAHGRGLVALAAGPQAVIVHDLRRAAAARPGRWREGAHEDAHRVLVQRAEVRVG